MAGFLDTQSTANQVEAIYIAYFGRAADGPGYLYWTQTFASELGHGLPVTTAATNIANSFAVQSETTAIYAFLASPPPQLNPNDPVQVAAVTTLVETVYGNLFNRAADSAGLAYWTGQILNGQVAVGAAIYAIADGALNSATALDQTVLADKISAAQDFTTTTFGANLGIVTAPATSLSQTFLAAARASVASVVDATTLAASIAATAAFVAPESSTATLTTGLDNVTASNIFGSLTLFNTDGHGPTLNPGDVLNGTFGATNNTLTITDLSANFAAGGNDLIPSGVALNNIQIVTLNSSGNTAAQGFNTTLFPSVNTLNVTTAGVLADVVQAGNGTNGTTATTIAVNHTSNIGGGVTVLGGTTVTVNAAGTGAAPVGGGLFNPDAPANGAVLVGLVAAGTVPPPINVAAGAIAVTSTNTGVGNIDVVGGTSVTVNTQSPSYTGVINIGNDPTNTFDSSFGGLANTAGDIIVQSVGAGAIIAFGGDTVTVNSGGGAVTVGDVGGVLASNEAQGLITVKDAAPVAYDGLNPGGFFGGGATSAIGGQHNFNNNLVQAYGGAAAGVQVTTNAGSVTVGTANAVAGTNTTGNVTVTDTANDQTDGIAGVVLVQVYGGANDSVTAQDDSVIVGSPSLAVADPTGTVTVVEKGASTMQDVSGLQPDGAGGLVANVFAPNTITIDGGNGVTVTSLGQTVAVGTNLGTAGAQAITQTGILTGAGMSQGAGGVTDDGGTTVSVITTGGFVTVGSPNFQPTGAVTIQDNFGSGNATADQISVMGGAAVGVTIASADTAGISVGAAAALNAGKSAVANTNVDPSGNVTIVDDQTNSVTVGTTTTSTTTYGTGPVNVFTNGATTDSITGGAVGNVVDVESTLGQGLGGPNTAVGKSTLATVSLIGNQSGAVAIQTDALTSLTIQSSLASAYNVTDNTAAYALGLTLGGDAKAIAINDVSNTAGSITVGDNGAASAGLVTLTSKGVATLTVNTTAAASLNLAGDSGLTTITAANKGALNLNDVSGLAKLTNINASTATGAIKVTINPGVTSFNGAGSTGGETVTLSQNAVGTGVKIVGGSPTAPAVNTIVANYAANAGGSTDTALGSSTQGFTTLGLGPLAISDAHTGTVFIPTATAQAQIDTVNIVTASNTTTYSAQITGFAAVSVVNPAGDAASIALSLANQLQAQQGVAGLQVLYTPGATSFTVQGAAAGTPFTMTATATTPADETLTVAKGQLANAGDASYDATGFTALTVGATTGDVTFTHVGNVVPLQIGAPNPLGGLTVSPGGGIGGIINDLLGTPKASSALPLTVGVDGTATVGTTPGTGTTSITATIATTGVPVISIASLGEVKSASGAAQTNTVTIGDTAVGAFTITGDQSLMLTLKSDTLGAIGAVGHVTLIDASASTGAIIDVTNVPMEEVVAGSTHTIKGGSGALMAVGGTGPLDADAFLVGTGGGTITLGSGGEWQQTPAQVLKDTGSYSSGSETVTLSATPVKTTTLKVSDGAVSTQATTSGATVGGVSGFVEAVTGADVLSYTAAKGETIIANTKAGVKVALINVPGEANMLMALGVSAAQTSDLNALSYTVSNGVISFDTAAGGTLLGSYSPQELVAAAEIILNGTGPSLIGAFSQLGNTFVVTDDAKQTLATITGANLDSVVELVNASSVLGFGTTGASNTVAVKGVALIDAPNFAPVTGALPTQIADTGNLQNQIYDETGFAQATLTQGALFPNILQPNSNAAELTQFYTLNNLAASAIVNIDAGPAGVGGGSHVGNFTITQLGANGTDSLTVNLGSAGNATTLDSLTVNGDAVLVFDTNAAATGVVTSLVDHTNSLASITIGGANVFSLDGITSTSLGTINITDTNNVTLMDAAAFAGVVTINDTGNVAAVVSGGALQIGLGVVGALAPNPFGLTGSGDTVTIGSGTINNNFNSVLHLSGSSDVITIDGTGANQIFASGSNDKIVVGDIANGIGADQIMATGANETVTLQGTAFVGVGSVIVTVGNSAVVNLSSTLGHFVPENVIISGDTTGGTSASFLQTTLNHAVDNEGQSITFGNLTTVGGGLTEVLAGATLANSMVNVASVSTLPDALNLAAAQAALAISPNPNFTTFGQIPKATGVIDWFQFQGNTYVVEAVNGGTTPASHTVLGAHDAVVELTGLVNIGLHGGFAGHTLSI